MPNETDLSTVVHAPGVRASAVCFEVRVTAGPDEGKTVTVSPRSAGRVLVGTSESCELRLTDRRASRRHLALDAHGGHLRVTDLDSTNGTTVNGLRAVDVFCQGGELVTIGDTTLRIDVDTAETEIPDVRMGWGPLVGASLTMRRLYRTCDALAKTRASLLVEGEPGTGKVSLAGALHAAGDAQKPLLIVEGAHLGASSDVETLIEEARGGTLVVHEIFDVPFDAHSAVAAQFAQTKGADVRVIATTCKNLDAAIEAGSFREELALEFSARIELPPLRERRGDIALLVEHFARRLGTTSAALPTKKLGALIRHEYRGNVGELERMVMHLLADASVSLTGAKGARPEDPLSRTPEALQLETSYRDILVASLPFVQAKQQVFDRFASAYVTYAVAQRGGHVASAAAASGLAPRYFNVLRARSRARKDCDEK